MVVGAPIYSETTQPEIGRIVIFVNENVFREREREIEREREKY